MAPFVALWAEAGQILENGVVEGGAVTEVMDVEADFPTAAVLALVAISGEGLLAERVPMIGLQIQGVFVGSAAHGMKEETGPWLEIVSGSC